MQNTLNQGEAFPPRSVSITHNYHVISRMTITCSSSWHEINTTVQTHELPVCNSL